jgi:hypothetical protein
MINLKEDLICFRTKPVAELGGPCLLFGGYSYQKIECNLFLFTEYLALCPNDQVQMANRITTSFSNNYTESEDLLTQDAKSILSSAKNLFSNEIKSLNNDILKANVLNSIKEGEVVNFDTLLNMKLKNQIPSSLFSYEKTTNIEMFSRYINKLA